ncbi:MAG TPA: hypothetical protein DCS82_05825 [Rhodospirillaceae bacterium]|nr:hypothetical protein [Rhodospirillaceae bacterium]HAA93762.1 hypothetical protein [Rhodospirillaceae bacterium]HAT35213.1 hypothetical protein [Rhodospirillaceae bacterium]|tara:strand:- start:254 stop:460 length:207 start_codon:yes stop_codon:yes gene_type:complete
MSPTTDQRLALFETELSQIVGEDLARDLIQYGRAPSVLEAQMLMADGVEELSEDMKNKILLLIEKHVG